MIHSHPKGYRKLNSLKFYQQYWIHFVLIFGLLLSLLWAILVLIQLETETNATNRQSNSDTKRAAPYLIKVDGLSSTILDDNYCDFLGENFKGRAEESGSSACSYWTPGKRLFTCVGLETGSTTKKIFSSRVEDGVCDCCDGSDEISGQVACTNTCKVRLRRRETAK